MEANSDSAKPGEEDEDATANEDSSCEKWKQKAQHCPFSATNLNRLTLRLLKNNILHKPHSCALKRSGTLVGLTTSCSLEVWFHWWTSCSFPLMKGASKVTSHTKHIIDWLVMASSVLATSTLSSSNKFFLHHQICGATMSTVGSSSLDEATAVHHNMWVPDEMFPHHRTTQFIKSQPGACGQNHSVVMLCTLSCEQELLSLCWTCNGFTLSKQATLFRRTLPLKRDPATCWGTCTAKHDQFCPWGLDLFLNNQHTWSLKWCLNSFSC